MLLRSSSSSEGGDEGSRVAVGGREDEDETKRASGGDDAGGRVHSGQGCDGAGRSGETCEADRYGLYFSKPPTSRAGATDAAARGVASKPPFEEEEQIARQGRHQQQRQPHPQAQALGGVAGVGVRVAGVPGLRLIFDVMTPAEEEAALAGVLDRGERGVPTSARPR